MKRNQLAKTGRKLAFLQIMLMVFVVSTCTLVTYLLLGRQPAISALWGGMIVIVPNCVFAYKAFKYAGAQASQKVVTSFYGGEKLKLGITVVFLALAFKLLVIYPVPFFTSFCLATVIPLLTPILFKL